MNANNVAPQSSFRLVVLLAILVASLAVLLWRVGELHIVDREFLQEQGDARYLRVAEIPAHRGMITDRHGELLAISTPVDSVWAHPRELLQARRQWSRLARILELDPDALARLLAERQDRSFVYLKRGVAPAVAARVRALDLPGVAFEREYRRYYPTGEVSGHVVGFTNVDDVGQEGIELAFDEWLRGTPGRKRVIRDRLGRVVANVASIAEPRHGKDLALSLDRRIQYLAYRELQRAVLTHRARSASMVVLDVRTGEVIAMVNQPAYNPNNRRDLRGSRYRNRAVTDVFEPGSTIKPFTVAAALSSGKFRSATVLNTAPGYMRVAGNTIRDIRNYGRIDVATVIQKSSNVGATKIALALLPETLWSLFDRVGFGHSTASGFPGEATGLLPHRANWHEIERATMAFGYGLSVTPLQLAQAYAMLANDGCLRPASFVRLEQAGDCERALDRDTSRAVMRMMEKVVADGGTGTLARVQGYRVAGKTGTVRKATAGGYSDERYQAIFAGVVPASEPRLAAVVVVDEPRGEHYYGGEVAAPVFARVMTGAMRLLNIAPDGLVEPTTKVALRESGQ